MDTRQAGPLDGKERKHCGTRHLRVGIALSARSATVASIWVVDQPVVQMTRLIGPVLVRIDIAGRSVLVEGFGDPRVRRGLYREKVGHHYSVDDTGLLYASVPFDDVRELTELRIRIINVSHVAVVPVDPTAVAALF